MNSTTAATAITDASIHRTASTDLNQSHVVIVVDKAFPVSIVEQLASLLESPRHRELFRRFLNAHLSGEVLEFWEEARAFAVLADDRTRAAKLRYIFEQYINDTAHTPINIDATERDEIKTLLNLYLSPKSRSISGGIDGTGSTIKVPPIFPTTLAHLEAAALETMASTHFLNFKKFLLAPDTVSIPRLIVSKDDLLLTAANRQRTLRKSNTTDAVVSASTTMIKKPTSVVTDSPKAVRKTSSADISQNRSISFWQALKQKFS